MADISKEQLTEVLSRVMREVTSETTLAERAFGVTDLQTQVTNLGKIGNAAWEISYKTNSAGLVDRLPDRLGQVAWEITYKTNSAGIIERVVDRTKG